MKPRFEQRCAKTCTDRWGRFRTGDQWVHLVGHTWWLCTPCAEKLGRQYGIPTTTQRRRQTTLREGRLQLPLEALFVADQVVLDLGQVDSPCEIRYAIASQSPL